MTTVKVLTGSWTRIETRSREVDAREAIRAGVADPLWFLGRQWQFGEFQGEDAASPVVARASWSTTQCKDIRVGSQTLPFDNRTPLDLAFAEAPLPDVRSRIELGLMLEAKLSANLVNDLRTMKLVVSPHQSRLADEDEATAYLAAFAEAPLDGVAILACTAKWETSEGLPSSLAGNTSAIQAFLETLKGLADQWNKRNGLPLLGTSTESSDPPNWVHDRLEHQLSISLELPGWDAKLDVRPGSDGELDWHSFEMREATKGDGRGTPGQASLMPARASFSGMPNVRYWDFEDGSTSLIDVSLTHRDICRIIVVDQMLVAGNDWFVIPIELSVGQACTIDKVEVVDVFGTVTPIERADDPKGRRKGTRWRMFQVSDDRVPEKPAPFIFIPPVLHASTSGPVFEAVSLQRDELANIAWAIERTRMSALGVPQEIRPPTVPRPTGGSPPHYHMSSQVPSNYFPLVPRVDQQEAEGPYNLPIKLVLGLVDLLDAKTNTPDEPQTNLLARKPFVLHEEEVPRSGIRLECLSRRGRWLDGSIVTFHTRRKRFIGGELSSGLRFDWLEGPK